MKSTSNHWDQIFTRTEDEMLGWYEKDTSPTFQLLHQIPDWEQATVFLPGAGTSILIDDLMSRGIKKVILNDISNEALNRVRQRLHKGCEHVHWLCQDIAEPITEPLPEVDIWIDRAVLHFLTSDDDIKGYFENLKSILKPGGHAIFAEFSLIGAPKCAGLALHRYSIDELSKKAGPSFTLVSHFDHTYIMPSGDPRPYIYALLKRER